MATELNVDTPEFAITLPNNFPVTSPTKFEFKVELKLRELALISPVTFASPPISQFCLP